MKFKVRLPGFKITAFQFGDAVLPDAVTTSDLVQRYSDAVREIVEDVEIGGEVKTIKRKQKVARNPLGRSVLRDWLIVEALSEGDAVAVFNKAAGVNPYLTQAKHQVVPLDAAEAAGVVSTAGGGTTAGPRKKRSVEDVLKQSLGRIPE